MELKAYWTVQDGYDGVMLERNGKKVFIPALLPDEDKEHFIM